MCCSSRIIKTVDGVKRSANCMRICIIITPLRFSERERGGGERERERERERDREKGERLRRERD